MNNRKNRGLWAVWALCALLSVCASCQDNVSESTDNGEFTTDWQARNTAWYDSVFALAKAEVAKAQAEYGNEWEDHCDWRVYPSYAKAESGRQAHDSICARIKSRSLSTATPLYTDSVKVNYMGRLIPTRSYPEGRVFDHSGLYEYEEYVFSENHSQPTRLLLSNTVEGYTTALIHMHLGDRWMIYIPQELGYSNVSSGVLPAYSTLCFDVQLKGFARKGTKLD